MSNWRDLLPYRTDPTNRPGATAADLVRLADQEGYSIVVGQDGRPVPIPKDVAPADIPSLMSNWGAIYDQSFHSFENRAKRVKSYKLMDGSGGLAAVVLDTYADEIVNISDNSDKALRLEFSDAAIGRQVIECLTANGVLSNMHQDIRTLCKYGDFSYAIIPTRGSELVKVTETAAKGGCKIDQPLRAQDIRLQFLSSSEYELAGYHSRVYKLRVERDVLGGFKFDSDEFMPWEFGLFAIANRDTFPYGLPVIEKMRVPFEQLQVMEKLLAVARANSIDRIGVKVPGLGGDIGTMMNKLSTLKNSIKTILQFSSTSRMTRNQDVGMTEYLFVPKEFEIDRLTTSLQSFNPEDVKYFRDNYKDSSRMPPGFWAGSSDSGGGQGNRPMSLRQRDLKFARSLIPPSEGYCNGLVNLCRLLAFFLGGDLSSLQVRASLTKSPYLSGDLVTAYKDAMSLIDEFTEIKKKIQPDYVVKPDDIRRLLALIDAPAQLLFPDDEESKWRGNSSQPSSLYEFCEGQHTWHDPEYVTEDDDPVKRLVRRHHDRLHQTAS